MKAILIILLVIVCFSCDQPLSDPNDYFPQITEASIIPTSNGAVLVSALVSSDISELEAVGISFDTVPNPNLLSNQTFLFLDGNKIVGEVENFVPFKKYCFKLWAVNKYGYGVSDIICLDQINSNQISPPCTLPENYIKLGVGGQTEFFDKISLPKQEIFEYIIRASSNSISMQLAFKIKPVTGIYNISNFVSKDDDVKITFISGLFNEGVTSGVVYVNQVTENKWTITICSALWSTNYLLNANLIVPTN